LPAAKGLVVIAAAKALYRSTLPPSWRERLTPLKRRAQVVMQNLRALAGRDGSVTLARRHVAGLYLIAAGGQEIFVASFARWNRYLKGIPAKLEDLATLYGHGEIYTVASGDTVIDIGANIGEFSMFCAGRGARCFALEADPRVFAPLVLNARAYPAMKPFNFAMWHENANIEIYSNVGEADSSAIRPDHFDTVFEQRALTLDCFAALMGIGDIAVIKCDAEGAEPEVLRGARETLARTRFVAFDCGPERQGQPTYEECAEILRSYGFDILAGAKRRRQLLFARNRALAAA
jgi:FkbM family methyltransferase